MKIFKYLKKLLHENSNPSKQRIAQEPIETIPSISLTNILKHENIEEKFIQEIEKNIDAIDELNQTQLKKLKKLILPNLQKGNYSPPAILKILTTEFNLSEPIATLITQNQSSRMTGTLNRLRYRKLGITKYIWRTAQDERVLGNPNGPHANYQPSHFARHGKIFDLSQPTEDGFPGEAMYCRCYAEPIFDDN
jgi:SPP1 gp7 family putative phage head morphogenesis protein